MKCNILFVLSHAFVGYKKKLKFCKNNQSQDVISSHSTRHCKGHNEIIMTFSATWMGIIPFVRRATEMTRLYLQTWCCFYINANFWVMKYIHGIFHYHWYKILLYFIKLQYLIVKRFDISVRKKYYRKGTNARYYFIWSTQHYAIDWQWRIYARHFNCFSLKLRISLKFQLSQRKHSVHR